MSAEILERAWRKRESVELGALRVFHGPGEGRGSSLEGYAIDRYSEEANRHHYWVTEWEVSSEAKRAIAEFLREAGA